MVRRVEEALKCQAVLLCASLPAPPCHVTASPQRPYLNQKGGDSAGWGPEGQEQECFVPGGERWGT